MAPNEGSAEGTAITTTQHRSSSSTTSSLESYRSFGDEARHLKETVKEESAHVVKEAGVQSIHLTDKLRRNMCQDWIALQRPTMASKTPEQVARDTALLAAWRAEQGLGGGPLVVHHGNTDAQHLTAIDFWAQTTFLSKHKSSQKGTTLSDSGPVPHWIKLGIICVRPILQHYEDAEESLTPWQTFIRESAKTVVKDLEAIWCTELERAWKEAEDEERREAEGSESVAE